MRQGQLALLEPKALSQDPVSGAREMDLLVKRLPNKYEGLSSYLLDLCENPGKVDTGERRDKMVPGAWESASLANSVRSSFSEGLCLKKMRWGRG